MLAVGRRVVIQLGSGCIALTGVSLAWTQCRSRKNGLCVASSRVLRGLVIARAALPEMRLTTCETAEISGSL